MNTTVYDYADLLLEKLCDESISSVDLEINDNTFDYVKELLENYKLLPNYEELGILKINKSDDVAYDHRMRGNKLFKNRKYFSALCAYNESLCYANPDSKSIGLAFANRSAVFLEIGEFVLCNENVKLAKEFGYPQSMFMKLDKRVEICNQNKNRKPSDKSSLRLSHKSNPKYPFIADCLRLKQNAEFGRHVVTDAVLKTGEIIAIEKPFCKFLLSNCTVKRCTNCLGQFKLNLLPCPGCTSAMFCSIKCMTEANKKFHRYECDILCDNFWRFFSTAVRSAFRILLQAFHDTDESFEKFKQMFKNNNDLDFTVFDVDIESVLFEKQLFIAMNHLCTNEKHRSEVEKFRRAIVSTIFCDYLQKQPKLKHFFSDNNKNRFFMNFMYRQTQIAESNFHELYALSPDKVFQENKQYGVGSFPFASLLNHSCSPNVFRLTHDGFNYIITSRCLEKGDQVFDNYGLHHSLQTKYHRKNVLLERYQFECQCEACSNGFPLFENLKEFDKTFDEFLGNDLEILEDFNQQESENAIEKYSKYINENITEFPSYEISLLQECILRCFRNFERINNGRLNFVS